jgi:hypothetical protein
MYGNGYETPISISWGNGSSISEIQNMISNARIVTWKRETQSKFLVAQLVRVF